MAFLIYGLFLFPLVFWIDPAQYEFPKVLLFYLISFLLLIFILFKRLILSFNQYWLIWILILIISSFLAGRIIPAFVGDEYRHQGIVFFLVLGFWFYIFQNHGQKYINKIFWLIGLTNLIESLILIINRFIGIPYLKSGTFGEINSSAGFLLLGIPVLVKILPWPILFLPASAILLTQSKTVILALLVEIILLKFWSFFIKRKMFFASFIICILLVGIFFVWQERNISVFESRWKIWQYGILALLDKPTFGWGPENFIKVYDMQFAKANLSLENLSIDRSHNFILDILLISGFAGFIVFCKWFWEVFKKIEEDWQITGLIGILIFSFFQPIGVVFWLYFIFFLSYSKDRQKPNQQDSQQKK